MKIHSDFGGSNVFVIKTFVFNTDFFNSTSVDESFVSSTKDIIVKVFGNYENASE